MVLTYAGDGQRCARRRGRESGCRNCCRGVRKPGGGANAGAGTQCDEFPFKSTAEGGRGAWTRCVTGWQNQLQGHYLSSWYADHGLRAGDQFVVRVVGYDCAAARSTDLQSCGGAIVKRQGGDDGHYGGDDDDDDDDGDDDDDNYDNDEEWTSSTPVGSGTETAVRRTLDNRTDVVVVAFGDLEGGRFRATARMVEGRLARARVLDSDGYEVAVPGGLDALYSEDGMVLDWRLDGFVGGVGLLGETTSRDVKLVWDLVEHSNLSVVDTGSDGGDGGGGGGESGSSRAVATSASLMISVVAGGVLSLLYFFLP